MQTPSVNTFPQQAWPADHVERRPTEALLAYAGNSRTHSREQIDQLAASIRQWGWTMPVLIDEDSVLIAGHARVIAARQLGLASVPVMVARGWSDTQKQAYVIADNQLALNAGWDTASLARELGDLRTAGFELPLLGFNPDQLAALLTPLTEGLTDPDDAPPLPERPVTRPGDVWTLGRHRLVCGDATNAADVAHCLGAVRPQLMVTDPPYGVDYDPHWRAAAGVNRNRSRMGEVTNDDRADWREAWALFPGDVAYVWHAGVHASEVQASLEAAAFKIRSQIIWAKDRFALSRGHYHWQHEPCWYAVRTVGHWAGDRSQTTLWNIPARDDSGHGHSTQKPVECMKRPIENNSSPGQAVYDPFIGSGTTLIAAEMTRRACHAMEISPAYVDVALLRWQSFTGQPAVLEGAEATYAAVAADRTNETGAGTEPTPALRVV